MLKNFFLYLEELPLSLGILVMMLIFMSFSVVAILSVRQNMNSKHLKNHHDVSGFVFTNLGVLYAVLLGFTVVNVQQRYDKINQTVIMEAGYIAELFRDAEAFSEKDKIAIQTAIKDYGKSIIDEEWKVTSEGKPNPNTTKKLSAIWQAYYATELTSRKQEILYAESIHKLNDSVMTRLSRLMQGKESLGDEMWMMLILGGILMVVFVSVFSFEVLWLHLILASFVAASIAFLLFLIYTLDTAFSGASSIDPDALKLVVSSFK